MYESDGEKYFIVDSHMHYWDASPENWVKGAEQYAKGWIECFHAYQSLGPPETHWTIEHFQKYSEDDLMKDVFEDGHVDVAIFQPTNLRALAVVPGSAGRTTMSATIRPEMRVVCRIFRPK